MVSVNTAFPSKWLKAADLNNREHTLVIDRIIFEDVGDGDPKPVMYFQGHQKGMVLNKTNAQTLAYVHGDEMDLWSGRQVVLFVQMVQFQSGMVPAIRCRGIHSSGAAMPGAVGGPPAQQPTGSAPLGGPGTQAAQHAQGTAAVPPQEGLASDLDDEIPFD